MSTHERKVTWIDLRTEPTGQKANLFEDTVELRVDDWILEKKSEPVTLEVFEQDSDDTKSDLLATFTGKILRHKKGFKFTWSKCEKPKASKETVVLLPKAFQFKAAGGTKTEALDILGEPDEGEGQTYDVSFRIKVGKTVVFTCQDPKKLYAEDEKCVLRVPIMGQQEPKYEKGTEKRTRFKQVEKEKDYFKKKDTIRYDYKDVLAEWTSCTRKVPFLNTSFERWPAAVGEHDLEMLTVSEAIERGVVLKLTARQVAEEATEEAAVDAAGDALDEAIDAGGVEAGTPEEEAGDASSEENQPTAAPAPTPVDKTLLNLNAYDHVLSPAFLPTYERLGAVETIQYGGCKLTSVANAMWFLGVFPKVLAGIASRDPEKALFPHYCGSKKTNKSSDSKKSSRKQCKETTRKGANVCAGCDHRKFDSNLPSDEKGRRQVPPLWFNVYLWWFILAHETDLKGKSDPGYACAKDRKLTTPRGNFKIEALIDNWGTELGLDWAKSGGSQIRLVNFKVSEVQEHGRQVRGLLRKGLPVYVSLRHRNHINLITGFKRTEAGEWRYLFWDPGGGGGFKVWSKLERANVYSAFRRFKDVRDLWEPEWEVKPGSR